MSDFLIIILFPIVRCGETMVFYDAIVGKKQFLIVNVFVVSVCFLLSFSLPLFAGEKIDPMLGLKAPGLTGKQAPGTGLLDLKKLMTEFGYKRDKNGKFIEVKGKYVFEIKKNAVVLNFFATTCIPCIREIPMYNRIAEKYTDKNVKFIYVNVDIEVSNAEISRFIARKQIKVPMMLPNQREAIKKYQVFALPRMIVINTKGQITQVISGFHEDLEEKLIQYVEDARKI